MRYKNSIEEVKALANYLDGFAESQNNEKLKRAAEYLHKLEWNICGAGMIGCRGGENCDSDHK